ncbi:hypothetical protein VPHD81_0078 [Vibrio phage D81]
MQNLKFIGYLIAGLGVLLLLGWLTIVVAKVFLFIGAAFFIWGALKIKKVWKGNNHVNGTN